MAVVIEKICGIAVLYDKIPILDRWQYFVGLAHKAVGGGREQWVESNILYGLTARRLALQSFCTSLCLNIIFDIVLLVSFGSSVTFPSQPGYQIRALDEDMHSTHLTVGQSYTLRTKGSIWNH